MNRAKRKQPERRQDCDFPAIALKGAIEQNAVGAYFGSWGALATTADRLSGAGGWSGEVTNGSRRTPAGASTRRRA